LQLFNVEPPLGRSVLDVAVACVKNGGTLIFPTDTVYGIGCDPFVPQAIDAIYGAKHRPDIKPLTLHLPTLAEFLEYSRDNPLAVLAARRLLPGPVTIVIRRPPWISPLVTSGLPTVGFRVPDDPLCSAILERCGPLAATSANVSGSTAYRGAGDWSALPPADLLVENGRTKYAAESSVIDLSTQRPRLLREGVVAYERLTELLESVERQAVPLRNASRI